MLEKPYIDLRNRAMATFAGIASFCVVILLLMLFFITSTIIRPLQNMVLATNKIAQGDLSHRVGITYKDEVGQLAHSFNKMAIELKKANKKLVQWGKTKKSGGANPGAADYAKFPAPIGKIGLPGKNGRRYSP